MKFIATVLIFAGLYFLASSKQSDEILIKQYSSYQAFDSEKNKFDEPISEVVIVKIEIDRRRIYVDGTWHKNTFFIQHKSFLTGLKIFDCSDSATHKGCTVELVEYKKDNYLKVEYSEINKIKFNK